MRKILMSINPEYVENIIKGIKKFEYRTKVAKKDVKSILVYCTYPTKKVVAEVQIKNIIQDTPEKLWVKTQYSSGVSKEFYDKYFEGRDIAYAYELGKILKYNKPRELSYYGINYAPQSYIYVMC